eukprot:GILJ01003942.1.p1 GENE.GILJ01003942.1~~GILJ01003942.1.p1  ORF type:complete len:181 (+),score=25.73 GILJ01003942.1:244-786(+)
MDINRGSLLQFACFKMSKLVVVVFAAFLLASQVSAKQCAQEDDAKSLSQTLSKFFDLFVVDDCETWANLFVDSGVFFHPMFPGGVSGKTELATFCKTNQAAKGPSLFRQDGQIRLTVSGSFYHALVPYVYSAVKDNGKEFINSGWEAAVLHRNADCSFSIITVTEFFNRAVLPFDFKPDQ